jgi:hypothetical protein
MKPGAPPKQLAGMSQGWCESIDRLVDLVVLF